MTRSTWAEVPTTVRGALEEALGDQVEEAASQRGGFSSGSADRLVLRRHLLHDSLQEFQRREAAAALGWLRRRRALDSVG